MKSTERPSPTINYKYDKAKADTQARRAIELIQSKKIIKSVGTNRDYRQCLKGLAQYIKDEKLGDLRHVTKETVERFLNDKKFDFQQKTLDQYRQAAQALIHARDGVEVKIDRVKSDILTVKEHRAYTLEQIERVASRQSEKYAFSTILAHAAGLRAHELLTIRRLSEQPADVRRYEDGSTKTLETKWKGREPGERYSVVGKGGLCREVRVPSDLARELENRRLSEPVCVKDRNVNYECQYDLAGGKKWSDSFSKASERELGWSTGAHGLRHSYAQERMSELTCTENEDKALATVSQEMGHWRPDITTEYLR